ncbi:MAG: L-rhamnose isomerase [Lentisphaeria bacterium]|nr:L-rhamnose isomerase [Lentisphaeria bacterium]
MADLIEDVRSNYFEPNYDKEKIAPYTLEDPLTFLDGRKVTTPEEWKQRRKEILGIFASEMYGAEPPAPEQLLIEKFEEKVGAWAVGSRALTKGLLIALLEPTKAIAAAESKLEYGSRMIRMEAAKTLPWQAVWAYYCAKHNCPDDFAMEQPIDAYEAKILAERN